MSDPTRGGGGVVQPTTTTTAPAPGGRSFGEKLLPWITAGASIAGDIYSSQQNKKEAEKNRQFQEDMSSTAAQRAVADYKAAGLNPALAYGKTESTPGGAQANIGNPLSGGIANGQQARALQQQLEIARQQSNLDAATKIGQMALTNAQTEKIVSEKQQIDFGVATQAEMFGWNKKRFEREGGRYQNEQERFGWDRMVQPYELRQEIANTRLREIGIAPAERAAKLDSFLGPVGGAGGLELIFSGARALTGAANAFRSRRPFSYDDESATEGNATFKRRTYK